MSRHSADPLAEYNARRDFRKTAEPVGAPARGKPRGAKRDPVFIVQKHAATRLHWDFRLEADGVLKSWAVTRGPSLDPGDKRLAVRTEDHPLAYADFEGVIPPGEYGGGAVMLWDRGTWAPVAGKSADDIEQGHLHFILDGERMKGEWLLVRMKPRPGEKRENWLLRKIDDAYASATIDLVAADLTSVLTGRTMAEIAADKAGTHSLAGKRGKAFAAEMDQAARHARRARKPSARTSLKTDGEHLPAFMAPQLATLVEAAPDGDGWLHEIKFDGYRALAAVNRDAVRIYTRSGRDWTDTFAPIAEALAALDLPATLIDGEVTAADANGNPSFSMLQAALKTRARGPSAPPLAFHAFDLLIFDGKDLTRLPNIERKARLAAALAEAAPPIFVADHLIGAGDRLRDAICAAAGEGVVSKRADAVYRSGRTRNWLKIKCARRQEFVVIGWTASSKRSRPFASLLLAQHDNGALVYKGKVGTGFDADSFADLAARMKRLARVKPAAAVPASEARGAQWIAPKLVAEVTYAEMTAQGRVRHASFIGLRSDKKASDVKPETPSPAPAMATSIRITHGDRVIFPDGGATKADLAGYYQAVAPLMLPFAEDRPISLLRCPQGVAQTCFFQKHDGGGMGEGVLKVRIAEKDGARKDYMAIGDAAGLLQCVQMGTVEFHVWAARADAVERPDRMIFDLDPDEGLDFGEVRRAAQDLRAQLADLGLISFALLSGSKGVHVVVPLTPGASWEVHAGFARRFAEAMSLAEPDRFVATMSKAKRKGRIFIDWLRNQRGATAIAPYSVRARAGAPVATPIGWDELPQVKSAAAFSISDADALIGRAAALVGWGTADQMLPDA